MNRKGFSLVELLAVIVILGVIMSIAVPATTKYLSRSQNTVYNSMYNALYDAASEYVVNINPLLVDHQSATYKRCTNNITCTDTVTKNGVCLPSSQYLYLRASYLVNEGYLEELTDPADRMTKCNDNSYVIVFLAYKAGDTLNSKKLIADDYRFDVHIVCGPSKVVGCMEFPES